MLIRTVSVAEKQQLWRTIRWPRPTGYALLDERLAREMLAHFRAPAELPLRLALLTAGSNSQSWVVADRQGPQFVLRCALGNRERQALEAMASAATALHAGGVATKMPVDAQAGGYTTLDSYGHPWQCWTWLKGRTPDGSHADSVLLGRALRHFHGVLGDWLRSGPSAHEPYWPQEIAASDIRRALATLHIPRDERPHTVNHALAAFELAGVGERLPTTAGHGDCHADNWLILAGDSTAAVMDLELIGIRPGAQPTDLGVLMHRVARLSARRAGGAAGRALKAAVVATLDLARAYGVELGTTKLALGCAIRESLAKLVGCALHGPPGLNSTGRVQVASNHLLYLRELMALRAELDISP